jgi:glyoxylase-like metal-dependent hydrolase (beta-lactamase superfamily II)
MQIQNLYPGSWGANCYLLTSGTHAAVVDPSAKAETILNAVAQAGCTLEMILLTHGHFDHIVSIDTLRDASGAPLLIHSYDRDMPSDGHKNAFFRVFGMSSPAYRDAERTLSDGEVLTLGEESIRVIHTPGHTAGCVCFLCGENMLLTGDTLFAGGIGRCDLYSSDPLCMEASLKQLATLPPDLTIYPGHGPTMRLGDALDRAGL